MSMSRHRIARRVIKLAPIAGIVFSFQQHNISINIIVGRSKEHLAQFILIVFFFVCESCARLGEFFLTLEGDERRMKEGIIFLKN